MVRLSRPLAFMIGCSSPVLTAVADHRPPMTVELQAAASTGEKNMESKSTSPPKHTNRLIHATSPYLLQHAHNPVDWHEWGPEALAKAAKENKPIFLSIGYAACHWCHVMEHETFESDRVAAFLNENFISIKVDREERPDLDELYMSYTQAMSGHGGWPMSVWLMPDGQPFYAGTYYPTTGFMNILEQIAKLWKENAEPIRSTAKSTETDFWPRIVELPAPSEAPIAQELLGQLTHQIAGSFDRTRGGQHGGGENKFPPSMAMELLLRVYRRTGASPLFEPVETTLDHMARGGIYDHLGGGICRYSTDRDWLVPHFEKMLYDQAMVSGIYLDAYQVTKKPLYAETAADILQYVLADLRSPEGGFYSSRDADSDGMEGTFYIWTVEEIEGILGPEQGRLCCAYFDVSSAGNWFESRGHAPAGPKNILHISKPPEAFAKLHGLGMEEIHRLIADWREKLLAARSKRTPPGLDDKILTAWNGLMIGSLAKASRVLDEPKYAEAAAAAAECILSKLRRGDRLLRTYRKGQARLPAYLEDYAFFIEGLLNLYEATFDRKWLEEARVLNEQAIKYFYDERGGAFFFTASDGEKLVARSKPPHDSAIPSGNSVQAMNLLRLAILLDRKDYRTKAESVFRTFGPMVAKSPGAFDRHLCAVDFYHDSVREIALIGDLSTSGAKELIRTVYSVYLPNKVLVHASEKGDEADMPLLRGKTRIDGEAAAYVCRNYTCRLPVTKPQDLARQLSDDK